MQTLAMACTSHHQKGAWEGFYTEGRCCTGNAVTEPHTASRYCSICSVGAAVACLRVSGTQLLCFMHHTLHKHSRPATAMPASLYDREPAPQRPCSSPFWSVCLIEYCYKAVSTQDVASDKVHTCTHSCQAVQCTLQPCPQHQCKLLGRAACDQAICWSSGTSSRQHL